MLPNKTLLAEPGILPRPAGTSKWRSGFCKPLELRAFGRKAYYIVPKRYSAEIDVRLPDIGKLLLLA